MKYSRKGHKDRYRHKNRIKHEWRSSVGLRQKHKPQHPHHVKVRPRGQILSNYPSSEPNNVSGYLNLSVRLFVGGIYTSKSIMIVLAAKLEG